MMHCCHGTSFTSSGTLFSKYVGKLPSTCRKKFCIITKWVPYANTYVNSLPVTCTQSSPFVSSGFARLFNLCFEIPHFFQTCLPCCKQIQQSDKDICAYSALRKLLCYQHSDGTAACMWPWKATRPVHSGYCSAVSRRETTLGVCFTAHVALTYRTCAPMQKRHAVYCLCSPGLWKITFQLFH